MIHFQWKKYIGLFFLSAILILLFMIIWRSLLFSVSEKRPFSLRVVVKSTTPQIARLYYNLGEGLSEKNPVASFLSGDSRFQDCSFSIPKQPIHGFRFDLEKPTASLVIKKIDIVMEIFSDFNITVKHIDLDNVKSVRQIKGFTRQENQLTVATTDDADNPQIAIPVAISFDTWYQSEYFLLLIRMILKILAVGILSALLLWIWFRWDDQTAGIIALIALVVFGLRCWPIYLRIRTMAPLDIVPVHFLIRALFELLPIFVVAMSMVLFSIYKKYRIELFIFVASVGIIFLAYPGIILNPRFLAEEGSLFFRQAYQSDAFSISSLFNNHENVGYYNLMPDFAAWVAATFFTLPYAPYATLGFSFLIQITPLYVIATSRNPLWDSPLKKTMGSLLVLLVPLSGEIWLNMLGSQVYLALVSFLILLEAGEKLSSWKKWLYRGLLLIGGFSGISSCALTPFFFLKWVHNRHRETLLYASLLMFTATLQLRSLLLSPNTRLSNMGEPYSLIANLVNTNFVTTLLGPAVSQNMSQIIYGTYSNAGEALPLLLISLLVGEAIFLYFLSRFSHNAWLSFTTLGVLLTIGIVAYIGMLSSKWETVDPYNSPRYFWFPNVIMALYVLFAVKEQSSFSRTIRGNILVAFCLLSILINGIMNYGMFDEYEKMPSWKDQANLWMQNDEKKTIALWPEGWYVELNKKKP
jgi:hypothetical protein